MKSKVALVSVLLVGLTGALSGATHTWTGTVSSSWSNNANWTGGTPAGDPSADLVFPATTRLTSTDDIPGISYVNSITFTASGYTLNAIGGSSIALADYIHTVDGTNTIDLPIALYGGANHLFFTQGFGSPVLLVSGVISGPPSESLGIGSGGTIDVTLTANNPFSGSTAIGSGLIHTGAGGRLFVQGSLTNSSVHVDGRGLSGTGSVGPVQVSTLVRPGVDAAPGTLTVVGTADFTPGGDLGVRLGGTAPGQYDQLNVQGSVALSHLTSGLEVVLASGFTPALGDSFTVVQATGGISDYFANPGAEGSVFSVDCLNFQIHYTANTIVITRVAGGGPALDGVSIDATGSRTACTNGTDGVATVTDLGGCNNTHQWGYRTVSGGSIISIAGETATTYTIDGHDFPGIGTYYLVETTTPGFGSPVTSNELTVTIVPPSTAVASGSATICPGGSVTLSGSGAANCSWSPSTGLSNANSCNPVASPTVTTTYSLTVSGASGCTSKNPAQVTVTVSPDCQTQGPAAFYTVAPCRVVDSRQAGGVPTLPGGSTNVFAIGGHCGVPVGAKAVALNVTVINPLSDGFLTLYPPGTARPPTSAINYRTGQVRANNATIPLDSAGELAVYCGGAGDYDLLIDVSGYYQ